MKSVDDSLGRDPDGADEEGGTFVDNNVDEGVELAMRVVVVGFPSRGAEGGEGKVDAEGEGGGGKGAFEVVDHGAEL